MRRSIVSALLVLTAAAGSALVVPAAAQQPAITAQSFHQRDIFVNSTTVSGSIYTQDGSAFSYWFEYGTTTAYGTTTPIRQSAPGQNNVEEQIAGLESGTVYHFRVVGRHQNGETALGQDVTFKTAGPGPHESPPGAITTKGTVGPGGTVSTGSAPSEANPIVVTLTLPDGGTAYIEELPNPTRPAAGEGVDPQNTGGKGRNWFGSAFQIDARVPTPVQNPDEGDGPRAKPVTVVWTIHGGADRTDRSERARYLHENPVLPGCDNFNGSGRKLTYLANGDVRITDRLECAYTMPTFHFYNPGWGFRGGEYSGAFYNPSSLEDMLKDGFLQLRLHCVLKCTRTIKATISRTSARALGLKSATLATHRSGPNADALQKIKLSSNVRKALRRANRITVTFKAKVVGPGGQVEKKTYTHQFKGGENEDSIG